MQLEDIKDQKAKDLIYKCLKSCEENRSIVDKIEYIEFYGRFFAIRNEGGINRISTKSGIGEQLNDFTDRQGLIFVVDVVDINEPPAIIKIPVEIPREEFLKLWQE